MSTPTTKSASSVETLRLLLAELRGFRRELETAGLVKPRGPRLRVVEDDEEAKADL
jgi:hypothetical protein